jgi:TPP-dependent indolepyruvate ferredoxin oxidoreductase alpha subunit
LLVTVPATARVKHPVILKQLEEAEKISETSPFNEIITIGKPQDVGIVTSGVSFTYVKEMAEELNLNVKILKLGMTHPIPRTKCEKFIQSCSSLIIVEELEPFLENQFKALAYDVGADIHRILSLARSPKFSKLKIRFPNQFNRRLKLHDARLHSVLAVRIEPRIMR